jgi:hypothetical protein
MLNPIESPLESSENNLQQFLVFQTNEIVVDLTLRKFPFLDQLEVLVEFQDQLDIYMQLKFNKHPLVLVISKVESKSYMYGFSNLSTPFVLLGFKDERKMQLVN